MTAATEKPKLKWHRFLQIIGLPVAILYYGYRLISLLADLAGRDFSWTDHMLSQALSVAGTDVFHLGPYFWPVVGMLAGTILLFVLAVLAWTGSLRWRSYSWKCWIAYLLLQMGMSFAGIWAIWEYGLNRGGLINFVQYYFMKTGKEIQVTSAMITAIRVFLILTAVLILVYFILNVIYYIKRRSLYSAGDDIQLPYEEEAVIPAEPKPVAKAETEPEKPAAPVFMEADQTPEPSVPETPAAPVFMEAEKEPEPQENNDELEQLLRDTEDSIAALKPVYEEPAEEPVTSETEEIRLTLDPPEEEEPLPVFTREMPSFSEEAEPEIPAEEEKPEIPAAEVIDVQAEEPAEEPEVIDLGEPEIPEIPVSEPAEESAPAEDVPAAPEIRFCPDCGTRIPDPEMKFCIRCGRRIR